MHIPVLKGRGFTERETGEGTPVAVVNQTLASRFFQGEEPLGKRLLINSLVPGKEELGLTVAWEIIGVAGNVKESGLSGDESSEIYVPFAQSVLPSTNLVVRTTSDPLQMSSAVQAALHAIDKDQPLTQIRTMEQVVLESVGQQRFRTLLIGSFALLALMLSCVGIYGVMSYTVTQHTNEIGICMALGAQTSDILWLVIKQGMKLTLIGIAIGLTAAFVLTRIMSSLLYGVSATDPVTFAGVTALLGTVALLACFIPARRATKVAPISALRHW